MKRFRNPVLTAALTLLMAAAVTVQLISPASEQMRMTTFVQWVDRSLPSEPDPVGENHPAESVRKSVEQLQQWLLESRAERPLPSGEERQTPPQTWPSPVWILQAWNDYNDLTDGMQATLSDRLINSGKWVLQQILPALSSHETGDREIPSLWSRLAERSFHLSPLRRPFLSGVSINAP